MKINKKSIIPLATVSFLLIAIIIVNIMILKESKKYLFYDEAKFDDFTVNKEEQFSLREDSKVELLFECKIERGDFHVEILNSEREVIFRKNGDSDSITCNIELAAGNYYYLLFANHANGSFIFWGDIN